MENLLEKYEKLYFSALEESLEQYKSDPIRLVKTLLTVSHLSRALIERLQLAYSSAEKASSTPSESLKQPSNEPTIEEIRQMLKATKDAARGLQGQAHAEALAIGWVGLYGRLVGGQ